MIDLNTRYVSILFVGHVNNANNYDETIGNTRTLHHISMADGSHINFSAVAIRAAIRDNANEIGIPSWRNRGADRTFTYADSTGSPQRLMSDACSHLSQTKYFDTTCFGYLVAAKNSNGATGSHSQVFVSPAVSLSPYRGDMEFNLGHKAKAGDDKSTLNPTSFEKHEDDYMFVMTVNAEAIRNINAEFGRNLFDTLVDENGLRGLRFGGNHARNDAPFEPSFVAVQSHRVSGHNLNIDPSQIHTVEEIQEALSHRQDVEFASGKANVADVLRRIRNSVF